MTAANLAILMKAVGFGASFLSQPVNVLPVVSTWARSARSTRRQSSNASHQTNPKASIRSGFFGNRLLTMIGPSKKAQFRSTPCGSL